MSLFRTRLHTTIYGDLILYFIGDFWIVSNKYASACVFLWRAKEKKKSLESSPVHYS